MLSSSVDDSVEDDSVGDDSVEDDSVEDNSVVVVLLLLAAVSEASVLPVSVEPKVVEEISDENSLVCNVVDNGNGDDDVADDSVVEASLAVLDTLASFSSCVVCIPSLIYN